MFLLEDLNAAGAQRQLVELVNGLPKDRFCCTLFTFGNKSTLLSSLDTASIEFHNFPRRFKADVGFVLELSKLLRDKDFDILHCTLDWAYLVGPLAHRLSSSKCKIVAAIHTTELGSAKARLWARAYLPTIRRADRVVFVAERQRKLWTERHGIPAERSVVIYNGVNVERLRPPIAMDRNPLILRSELGLSSQDFVVGMVARFRPEKRHDLAIAGFAKALESRLPLKLICVGDGEMLGKAEAYAHEMGCDPHVLFVGQRFPILPFLQIFDTLILTSTAVETFSMAALEALATGVPVISADIGGQREMIFHGENGYLFPVGDWQMLSSYIVDLAVDRDRARQMGMRGREIVLSKFSTDEMVRSYSKLFEDLTRNT